VIRTAIYASLILVAVVVANLLVNAHGPSVTPYVAAGLIGFDIVGRDRLHLDLSGPARWAALGVLIGAGSLLTWLLNPDAGDIALASVAAFAGAMVVDSIVFELDTTVFFAIAFGLGAVPFVLIFSQWTAKVAGGAIFGMLLVRERRPEPAGAMIFAEPDR
jgi:queuosine precursor transporter